MYALQGYKTWVGLVTTFLGFIGFYEKTGIVPEQVSQIADSTIQLIGLVIAAYGNYDAHKRINKQ